jgi:8-hydroxy-5-deazaflavin:NADPH oxidoreductase
VSTAIIGVGRIGTALAAALTAGGEAVVLAASTPTASADVARSLGALASSGSVADAVGQADTVVFAVWLDVMKQLIGRYAGELGGKVVIDPSNPIGPDGNGGFARTLPDGVSSGSVVAGLLPASAHYVKAFGTVSAEHLADGANRSPERAVLFYATDDDAARSAAERLISVAGFAPVKVGGVDQAIRIEVFGDLHDLGGLDGKLLTTAEAHTLLAGTRG